MTLADTADADGERVTAIWRQHQVSFGFHSSNVRYSCDALQSKVSNLLMAIGAHPNMALDLSCQSGGFVDSARFRVTLKLPVVASEENVRLATTYSTEQQLVARLHSVQLPSATDLPRFSAEWRTVTLTRDRRVNLDAGDCDLLAGLRKQLLPQLGIESANGDFRCYGDGTRLRPLFRVSTLMPVAPSPEPVASTAQANTTTIE
jgi:hypothetical protein